MYPLFISSGAENNYHEKRAAGTLGIQTSFYNCIIRLQQDSFILLLDGA
jgi:hypothetical protein